MPTWSFFVARAHQRVGLYGGPVRHGPQHPTPEVAIPIAIGFEWTWLRGIATAGKVQADLEAKRWIGLLTITALITVVCYGLLYILGLSAVGLIPARPGPGWGFILAVTKVMPIALMGYAAANLHRIHKQQLPAEQARKDKEIERQDRLQAAEDQRRTAIAKAEADLMLERKRKEMELGLWQQGQEIKRQMRARPAAQPPTRNKPGTDASIIRMPTISYQASTLDIRHGPNILDSLNDPISDLQAWFSASEWTV